MCEGDCTWCKFVADDEEIEGGVVDGVHVLSEKSMRVSKEKQCRATVTNIINRMRHDRRAGVVNPMLQV